MIMELDDFKAAWQTLDRRLEQQYALDFQVFKDGRISKVKSALRPLMIGQVVQIVCGSLLLIVSAQFWIAHRHVPHLMLCGILLHAYSVLLVMFAGRDLHLILNLDYTVPVLQIQRQLAELRMRRARVAPWVFGVTGCFIWIPMMLVIFQWLGVDVWVRSPSVVYIFVASGFVSLMFLLGLMKWARAPHRVKAFDDSSAGRSVCRAQAVLDEIARFEKG
jgi:hypothetical protein